MVPQALKEAAQWLVWRLEDKPGAKKPAKMPYYANGARRTGQQGSDEDRSRLTTFEHAMTAMTRGGYQGVGFAFLPGDGLIGIDIDGAIDPETGEVSERARAIVDACQSFTEKSPSGRGLHVYCRGTTRINKSDDIGVELFCGKQFFTVTGEHWPGTPERVNDISPQALALVHGMVDEAKALHREVARMQAAHNAQLPVMPDISTAPAVAVAPAPTKAAQAAGGNDFARVNAAAMANLDAWVTALFPKAIRTSQGWRVTSQALGRDLQEDLSIHRDGIVDYGVHDIGDPRAGRRSPIDLAMEWSAHKTPAEALHWLAGQVGVQVAKPTGSPGKRARSAPGEGGGSAPAGGGDGGGGGADAPGCDGGPPEGLPVIEWRLGALPEIVDAAEQALLARTEDRLYQRSGMLVRIVRRPMHSNRSYKRPPGVLGTVVVESPYLTELLTRSAWWQKYDPRAKEWRHINAPEQVSSTYMARTYSWKLPVLWSTITAPTLRPDGTLLQVPGYDPAMRAYYDPNGVEFPKVPDAPTKAEATAALDVLLNAVSTFPFESEVDRSVCIAMMLTALVRRSLPSAPLGAITAPSPESGKTLLADAIATLAMGTGAPAMKYAETDEEAAKIALSVLMEGDPVVVIDNIERPLQGDWLCTMLTSEAYKARVLGRSEMINVPTNCLWLATGNHIVIQGDLRHRTLLVRLDARMERPGERVFKADLRVWMTDHRAKLVAAGLTVMRAFQVSGVDPRTLCPPWGRFEQWTDMVRAPLIWLGLEDPNASLSALEADDPARQEHLAVLATWHAAFGDKELTARTLIELITGEAVGGGDAGRLRELLGEFAKDRQGVFNVRRLSSWLRRHSGRRVSGFQLVKVCERDHTGVWRVDCVKDGEAKGSA